MPAERLSYLTEEEQLALVDIMEDLEVNGKNERKRKHLPNSRHNQSPCGQWTFHRPQGLLLFLCIEIRIFDRNKKSERLSHSESVRIIRMCVATQKLIETKSESQPL